MLTTLLRGARSAAVLGGMALAGMLQCGAAEQTAADRVRSLLEAGELGAARAAALAETDDARQAALLDLVDTVRRTGSPDALDRTGDAGAGTSGQATGPGSESLSGTGADFTSLINLIQEQTEGPWEDIDGEGGRMTPFISGVHVDPQGVLERVERSAGAGTLAALGVQARRASLNRDLAQPSALRMVSLTRLEREVAARLARGEAVVDSMQHLAGLSEIRYVFIDPAEREIVLAGPAEGWNYSESGRPVGAASGLPKLRLDDLVTVLRTFAPEGRGEFGCSIDPREAGLQAVKEFVEESQKRGPLANGEARTFARQVGDVLGRQDIRVFGVPADSRVARVLVEADYRMKLIGVGKLDGGQNIPSYFDILARQPSLAGGSLDALRWWLTLQTEAVLHTPDRTAFEIQGASVKCLSENQYITSTGGRASTGKAEPVNRQFAENFTAHYGELAHQDPVFADLEGVFDLALAAALIRREALADRVDVSLGVFEVGGKYQPAQYAAPREVDSVVNHRVYNGRDVVVQIAGGVQAQVFDAIENPNVQRVAPELANVEQSSRPGPLPAGRWWWDAAK